MGLCIYHTRPKNVYYCMMFSIYIVIMIITIVLRLSRHIVLNQLYDQCDDDYFKRFQYQFTSMMDTDL